MGEIGMSNRERLDCPRHGLSKWGYCEACMNEREEKDKAEKESYKAMPKSMRL